MSGRVSSNQYTGFKSSRTTIDPIADAEFQMMGLVTHDHMRFLRPAEDGLDVLGFIGNIITHENRVQSSLDDGRICRKIVAYGTYMADFELRIADRMARS